MMMGIQGGKKEMAMRRRRDMEEWFDAYAVPRSVLDVLESSGFNSLGRVVGITQEQLERLALNPGQRALLRGALLQHRANATVDKIAHTTDSTEQDRLVSSLNQRDLKDLKNRMLKKKHEDRERDREKERNADLGETSR